MSNGKVQILVVDDEEHVRELLQRILEMDGYDVVTARSGQEAVDTLSLTGIDLILLDVRMPGLDGFQTLALIREKSNIPVLMVTGATGVTSVADAFTLGADDYVSKPFNSGVLLARIKAKLRRAGNETRG